MHGERRTERTPPAWRRTLRHELAALLALKVAALWLLWALCFSPVHRAPAGLDAASRALGMRPAATQRAPGAERGA